MQDSTTLTIDQEEMIISAYKATNYYAMKLEVDLNNGKRAHLRRTFEDLRYALIGLYNTVRHHPDFDPKLKIEVEQWRAIRTKRKLSENYYRYSIKLYNKLIDHIAFIQILKLR